MRYLMLAVVAALAVPASAAAPETRIAALIAANATAIGAPVPAGFEFSPAVHAGGGVLAPRKARAASPKSDHVSGSGWVTGNGYLWCSAPANQPNGSGWFSGTVWLNGNIRVYGSDGSAGDAYLNGSVFVSGSCRAGGSGFASGWARLSGRAQMYKDGKPAGYADVDGNEYLSQYVNGGSVWFNQYYTVSGWANN